MSYPYKYPHIANLLTLRPTPRILLGKRLNWTEKKDGSCIAIWKNENKEINIASRHQEQASEDLVNLVVNTPEYPQVLQVIEHNPEFVVYVEACRKGRSVTGAELYDRNFLICFDIYSMKDQTFLTYTNTHQMCYHEGLPIVKLWAETRHTSMRDLLKWKNHALEYCDAMKIEGMVIKAFGKRFGNNRDYIQAKVKLDIPQPIRRKIAKGEPVLPEIPDVDILGAIDKVWQELGTEQFRDVRVAMPKVAAEVSKECKNHLYSSPKKKLFSFYQEYLERLA